MLEITIFTLLLIGTIIGAVGGFLGASIVFFPIKAGKWLFSEEGAEEEIEAN